MLNPSSQCSSGASSVCEVNLGKKLSDPKDQGFFAALRMTGGSLPLVGCEAERAHQGAALEDKEAGFLARQLHNGRSSLRAGALG